MPTKRRALVRVAGSELNQGQIAFLLGEADLPIDADVRSFNRFCWLCNGLRKDPEAALADGTPGPAPLWREFGRDALETWHEKHGDRPHPLVKTLGLPG